MNKLLEKDDWMIIVILFKFWRECSCTKEYIQKENIKNKKIGGGGKCERQGQLFWVVLLCITGKLFQQEKQCFVFLLLEEIITALNVCRRTRNRARLEFKGC